MLQENENKIENMEDVFYQTNNQIIHILKHLK